MFSRKVVDSSAKTPKVTKSNFISSFIAESSLFKSTPDPAMFGNDPNPSSSSPSRKGWDQENWLTSRFHFSFAEYYDPARGNFGPMRVLNDDRVSPNRMFSTHGHAESEIVTVVVEGDLTHADSMGNKETLQRGSAQYLSAGTGIRHSEGNNSVDKMLRFCQLWFTPNKRGVKPNYGSISSTSYDAEKRKNKFFHMITDYDNKNPACSDVKVRLHCDINLFISEVDAGATVQFPVAANRAIYTVCCEGNKIETSMKSGADEHKQDLTRHDAVTVGAFEDTTVDFKNASANNEKAFLLLIEMANPEKRQ